MHRLKITLPKQVHFTCELTIRITDLNYANHLGNDSVLSLIHEARVACLRHYGFDEGKLALIQVDTAILYKMQGSYGQKLLIDVSIANLAKIGCDFYFRIIDRDTKQEFARAKTAMAFFDYKRQKVIRIPESFLQIFATKDQELSTKVPL